MSDINLEQEFENNFDCYINEDVPSSMQDEVEMVMTKGKFVEVVAKLLQANGAATSDSGLHLQRVSPSAFLAEPEDGTSILVYGKDTWDADRKLRENGHDDCIFKEFDKTLH